MLLPNVYSLLVSVFVFFALHVCFAEASHVCPFKVVVTYKASDDQWEVTKSSLRHQYCTLDDAKEVSWCFLSELSCS